MGPICEHYLHICAEYELVAGWAVVTRIGIVPSGRRHTYPTRPLIMYQISGPRSSSEWIFISRITITTD